MYNIMVTWELKEYNKRDCIIGCMKKGDKIKVTDGTTTIEFEV